MMKIMGGAGMIKRTGGAGMTEEDLRSRYYQEDEEGQG
jgi:hypothetical protein